VDEISHSVVCFAEMATHMVAQVECGLHEFHVFRGTPCHNAVLP